MFFGKKVFAEVLEKLDAGTLVVVVFAGQRLNKAVDRLLRVRSTIVADTHNIQDVVIRVAIDNLVYFRFVGEMIWDDSRNRDLQHQVTPDGRLFPRNPVSRLFRQLQLQVLHNSIISTRLQGDQDKEYDSNLLTEGLHALKITKIQV